jgi:hypothetical protein
MLTKHSVGSICPQIRKTLAHFDETWIIFLFALQQVMNSKMVSVTVAGLFGDVISGQESPLAIDFRKLHSILRILIIAIPVSLKMGNKGPLNRLTTSFAICDATWRKSSHFRFKRIAENQLFLLKAVRNNP